MGYSHGLPSALQFAFAKWTYWFLSSRYPVSGGVPRIWGTGGYPGTRQVVKSRPTLRSRIDHRGLAAVSDASPLALDSATLLMFALAFMSAFMWSFAFVICICMYLTPSASSLGLLYTQTHTHTQTRIRLQGFLLVYTNSVAFRSQDLAPPVIVAFLLRDACCAPGQGL